jgi:hypothetical protein
MTYSLDKAIDRQLVECTIQMEATMLLVIAEGIQPTSYSLAMKG